MEEACLQGIFSSFLLYAEWGHKSLKSFVPTKVQFNFALKF